MHTVTTRDRTEAVACPQVGAPRGLGTPPSPTYAVHDDSILRPGLRVGDVAANILDGGRV